MNRSIISLTSGMCLALAAPALAENLLRNASFAEGDAVPTAWQAVNWNTGGRSETAEENGNRYVVLAGTSDQQRACWRQQVPFGGNLAVFEGRMRTRGVAATDNRGASVRLLFRDDERELSLQQAFFPPSGEWTEVSHRFPIPAGTRVIVVELLHWFTPGETHWDEPVLRQASDAELAEVVRASLDREPRQTEKPFHPADGQTVQVTPPPFIWLPVPSASSYQLQIAPSDQFNPAETRTFSGLRRSVYVPGEPLPPGKWFWRCGIETGAGPLFGTPRSFTVPETARAFPFPDFDQIVAAVPRTRPRLFFPGARLDDVRALARGEFKQAVDGLVARCLQAVDEELVPEPGYQPQNRAERGPWAVNVMQTTRPPMNVMENCALAYLLTGDERLGREAKRRLLHFFSWDPEGPTSFFAYDEPPMWVMMRGSRAYDWTYDLFTPEERALVEPNMNARARQFLRRLEGMPFESNPYESHAGRLPGFLGEAAISFIHEWPEAREWLEYATLIYYTSYPAWGGDDGGWQEGPGYWSAYMGFALHFVVALRNATGVDLTGKPFFRNTPFYGLYTATPYHEHSPYGDGQNGRPTGLRGVMAAFANLLHDPHLLWHAQTAGHRPGADLLGLATHVPELAPVPPLELPQARVFPDVGLAALHTALGDRNRDITFLLRSSPFGSVSHGHADQNAFVIEAFGRGLAIATGHYPWYGSPHHHEWTRATRAKNSILVNGEGQVSRSWTARGAITAFHHGEDYDFIEGEAAEAYGGRLERFRRQVVHLRPGIFVMLDSLRAKEPSTFQWLLHAYDEIRVDAARGHLRIEREPAAMDVHLLLPAAVDITQTDRYEPEPERGNFTNTWHLAASTTQAATDALFLAVFLPHRMDDGQTLPRVERIDGAGAVGVRLLFPDGREEVVAFRTDENSPRVAVGGLRSDARVFARGRGPGGTATRRLLLDGALLEETPVPAE